MNTPRSKQTLHRIVCAAIGTLLSALLCGELDANAAPPIININPSTDLALYPGFEEVHGNGMVGWTFQLLVPFTVTQVGWYDKGADGLPRAWQVGLWKGEGRDGEPPRFPGPQYFSLIGDPQNGLIIPS